MYRKDEYMESGLSLGQRSKHIRQDLTVQQITFVFINSLALNWPVQPGAGFLHYCLQSSRLKLY